MRILIPFRYLPQITRSHTQFPLFFIFPSSFSTRCLRFKQRNSSIGGSQQESDPETKNLPCVVKGIFLLKHGAE
jgi:hypothetical protein